MKNYFKKILSLFTEADHSETVQQDFYHWLVNDEHTSEKDDALRGLWEEAHKKGEAPNMRQSFETLRKNAGIPSAQPVRKIQPIRIWQIAAVTFFVLAASSIYLFMTGTKTEMDLIQQYIPVAEVRTLTLPDGTRVQLNSGSTLLYPQNFAGKERSVFLIGEANFKVKQDKEHPFIVKSNDLHVTALGTEFNISAYPENPVIEATLISGSILVKYNNLNDQVILKPNQQLAYNRCSHKFCIDNPDMNNVTAWQRGELVFVEMTMKDIITILERKYPFRFVYSLKDLKEDKFSFRFKEYAPLSEVMDVIVKVVGGMDYKIQNDCCYLIYK